MVLPKIEEFLEEKMRNFICSEDAPTVVDIQYYCEIKQITILDPKLELSREKFPQINQWMERVRKAFAKASTANAQPQKPGAKSAVSKNIIDELDQNYKNIIQKY